MWFLARIDQQVKSYHSSSSIQYSNIKSVSMTKLHFFMQIIWILARIDQQAEILPRTKPRTGTLRTTAKKRQTSQLRCTILYSTVQYSNIKSVSMINIHFSNEIIYFLARIDQQAEIYHSRLSKDYSSIKSVSMINIHIFQ